VSSAAAGAPATHLQPARWPGMVQARAVGRTCAAAAAAASSPRSRRMAASRSAVAWRAAASSAAAALAAAAWRSAQRAWRARTRADQGCQGAEPLHRSWMQQCACRGARLHADPAAARGPGSVCNARVVALIASLSAVWPQTCGPCFYQRIMPLNHASARAAAARHADPAAQAWPAQAPGSAARTSASRRSAAWRARSPAAASAARRSAACAPTSASRSSAAWRARSAGGGGPGPRARPAAPPPRPPGALLLPPPPPLRPPPPPPRPPRPPRARAPGGPCACTLTRRFSHGANTSGVACEAARLARVCWAARLLVNPALP